MLTFPLFLNRVRKYDLDRRVLNRAGVECCLIDPHAEPLSGKIEVFRSNSLFERYFQLGGVPCEVSFDRNCRIIGQENESVCLVLRRDPVFNRLLASGPYNLKLSS